MSKIFLTQKIIRSQVKLISLVFPRSLPIIEEYSQRLQGKGDGAVSVEIEIHALSHFVDTNSKLVIIDIGANIGNYTSSLLDKFPYAQIYSIEPASEAFKKLQENIGFERRVNLLNLAIGKFDGVCKLYSDSGASGLASLTKRDLSFLDISFELIEEISIAKLDTLTQELGIKADVVKIDVEGHELDVLEGGKKTFNNVTVLQFEFGGANLSSRTQFRDFWNLLTAEGFSIFRITKKGILEIDRYTESLETYRTTNYIAVKNPKKRKNLSKLIRRHGNNK